MLVFCRKTAREWIAAGLLAGLGASGASAALVAAAGTLAAPTPARAQAAPITDVEIFQFALNFEYLGAQLYLHALTGTGLPAADTTGIGNLGTVSAGGPVPFLTPAIKQIVEKLAADELAHVLLLRKLLGGNTIAQPTINLSTSWTTLALTAGLIRPGQVFNPFADEISLLIGAYVLEDVCVTALAGAASLLTVPADITTAGGLLGTEAAQAGTIRTLLSIFDLGFVTDAISTVRATLSGAPDDIGTSIPGNKFNFVSNDANGLVFTRTPSQVLNVAYGGGAASNFLFFPNRVNGPIQS